MRLAHLASLAAANSNSGSGLFGILPMFIIMGVAMYFLIIRPQKKRQREAVQLQSSIEVGDEVMTTSGVYGFVTSFEGDIAWLEIDDDVQIRIARQAIQRKVDTSKGETAVPTDKDAPAPVAADDLAKDES
ncbi:MAG: preprotein translocase subunit YajC [Ilumatobacteraceae bacterium]|jgi:preprotein translocase subunit YajC